MSGPNALNSKQPPIQSTAGAVPIRNEKGISRRNWETVSFDRFAISMSCTKSL